MKGNSDTWKKILNENEFRRSNVTNHSRAASPEQKEIKRLRKEQRWMQKEMRSMDKTIHVYGICILALGVWVLLFTVSTMLGLPC